MTLADCCSHNISIGQRRGLRETEDSISKAIASRAEALFQTHSPLIGTDFAYTKGNFSNLDRGQCQLSIIADQPGNDRSVRRFAQ